MKAVIESNKTVEVDNVTITGMYDTMLASFVNYTAPLVTTNIPDLLKVKQAGFSFYVNGDLVYITSRKLFTKFI